MGRASIEGPIAIYADGAFCLRKLARALNIKIFEAVHQRKHFSNRFKRKLRGFSQQAGTQVLDCHWQSLKTFVPATLNKQLPDSVNPDLEKYCFQWCWQQNANIATSKAYLNTLNSDPFEEGKGAEELPWTTSKPRLLRHIASFRTWLALTWPYFYILFKRPLQREPTGYPGTPLDSIPI